jgi:hypothetical protein
MNERLIRGESNTNMPFPSQGFEVELSQAQSAHPNAGANSQNPKPSQF